jgi:DNA-binding winged helix-turn-helix (wHTH) protein
VLELRKSGLKLKLSGQPFQVLAILLEYPGEVVTREELQKRLWRDSFVDFDHNLNTAINKIREALGDPRENPRFVETLPRRGYRFIAPVDSYGASDSILKPQIDSANRADPRGGLQLHSRSKTLTYLVVAGGITLLTAAAAFLAYRESQPPRGPRPRALTRLTFGDGLQMEPTWSPDGRFIAYTSDRGGKLDVWVQQVSGGDPVQVTHGPGNNWQPSWSPDGEYIAYRAEGAQSGLFITPALGGKGLERRIASFGHKPRWSPDGSQILFQTLIGLSTPKNSFYVVGLDGSTPQQVLEEFTREHKHMASVAWQPRGKNISIWANAGAEVIPSPKFWTASLSGGAATSWKIAPEVVEELPKIGSATPMPDADYNFSWAPPAKRFISGMSIKAPKTFGK